MQSDTQRKDPGFRTTYGPWALVTGASSGIGAAIADELAVKGLNLILVARNEDALSHRAAAYRSRFGITARAISADLATAEGINRVFEESSGLDVGLLVNNAGREESGPFFDIPIDRAVGSLDLNCRAPLQLAHHFGKPMADRGSGGIVFLSSIVAFQGVRYIGNYAAAKAYDLILAESLAAELEPAGIDVIAVAPGFTSTSLSPEADFGGIPITPMSPEAVARRAIGKLGRARLVIPGITNKFLFLSGKYLQPRRMNTFAFSQVFRRILRRKLAGSNDLRPSNLRAENRATRADDKPGSKMPG